MRTIRLVVVIMVMGLMSITILQLRSEAHGQGKRIDGVARLSADRGKPARWFVLGRPGDNKVRIGGNFGWCPDLGKTAQPRFTGVRQVGHRDAVVLTAYLAQRSPSKCAGVESLVEYVVDIRGGRGGRPLFDGSTEPPARRWPRSRRRVALKPTFCANSANWKHPGKGVRLAINGQSFRPGEEATIRLLNEGRHPISFGFDPKVEYWHHGAWRRRPILKNGLPVLYGSPLVVLSGPGRSGCLGVPLSPEWSSGKYRVRQNVVVRLGGRRHRALQLTARFDIREGR